MTQYILVAVAWPYANGRLHLGRVVGAYLPADIFGRYQRLRGSRVLMVSGSDVHGTPITIAADAAGVPPLDFFTPIHRNFLESQQALGISYDLFTHTDTANHQRVAQDIFRRLVENGYIYERPQQLLYSEQERRYLPDRYVQGQCPHCGFADARGDQCEQCGRILDAVELINPRSTVDGSRPVVRETTHLFFDLAAFSQPLLAHLAQHEDHWRTHPLNFTRSFIAQGLQPRPFTRDLDWGIDVPLPGWEGKKLYIWAENVVGYLSASIEWARLQGTPDAWRDWWTNPHARSYYFLGKDNIPFHTIIWPAQLLGVGDYVDGRSLNLPYDVPANAYLTLEGRKFSTSRNHAVWLDDLLSRYDPDAIRYYLTAIMPETADADFSWEGFVQRHNGELVAAWGNLVHRVLSFAYRHWGAVPPPGVQRPFDRELLAHIETGFAQVGELLAAVKLRAALQVTLALARAVNRYLDQAPWYGVIKTDRAAAATTVYTALRAIDTLKVLFAPFLPFSSERLHALLGYSVPLFGTQRIITVEEANQSHRALVYDVRLASGRWQVSKLEAERPLAQPTPLFQKLDEAVIAEERARLFGDQVVG